MPRALGSNADFGRQVGNNIHRRSAQCQPNSWEEETAVNFFGAGINCFRGDHFLLDNADTKTQTKKSRNTQRLLRSAVASIGVTAFLFLFRPFGLAIDSMTEALVLLGVAPTSFLLMLIIHALPLRKQPWRTVLALGILVVGNTLYLAAWSERAYSFETPLAVALVVALTATIVFLWNRGRIPEQEIDIGNSRDEASASSVIFAGDGEQEILQLAPSELLFLKANGNYVDVHYLQDGLPAKSMLRGSLARLAGQVPEDLLIQCHRSYFVNLSVARRIVRAKGRTFIEFDAGDQLPVSRMFKQDVLRAISA